MRVRELEISRALAEAGEGRSVEGQPSQSWGAGRVSTDADAMPDENALEHRRGVLLAQMRESLETTRHAVRRSPPPWRTRESSFSGLVVGSAARMTCTKRLLL